MKLRTIGYEAATQSAVIACLKGAGVEVVIDVRAVASSRRAGFSKTILAASLAEAGIGYVHLRALGTPKAGRIANRAGRMDEFRRIYDRSFHEPEAQLALLECAELCRGQASALMCFCGNEAKCHRHIIAEALQAMGLKQAEIAFPPPA